MATTAIPQSTPKRKRGGDGESGPSPIKFSFESAAGLGAGAAPIEDGSSSPRSKVAHEFRGLVLGGGGGVAAAAAAATAAHSDIDIDDEESLSKRLRPDEPMGEPLQVSDVADLDGKLIETVDDSQAQGQGQRDNNSADTQEHGDDDDEDDDAETGGLQRAYPSINRLSDSKSRVSKKKRAGSPPLRVKKTSRRPETEDSEDEPEIVDPVRAALTWHEDEITIYDPDDDDDDGTGINGIGFKPTPALAQARARKRRQQMAEYRKREESDARARRNERRRGRNAVATAAAAAGSASPDRSASSRKVRFLDAEAAKIGITTGFAM